MIRVYILFYFLVIGGFVFAADPLPLPKETPWDLEALKKTPKFTWVNQKGGVHSLTYAGERYRGKPTSVFAYYASPSTLGKLTEKVPGIVLVHGGGGAAFSNWAELWAKRGYAAIAMDLAGKGNGRKPLPDGGPDQGHAQKFTTIDEPINNQWSYHAVANVVRAHSLLRSFAGVDSGRVALTGISWGGYLTCIVAGVDDRFKVAMPVYGCGFLRENSAWKQSEFGKMTKAQSDKWHRLWDPSRYIGSAKMPVMFLNGTNDFAYWPSVWQKSAATAAGPRQLRMKLRWPHGHIPEAEEARELVHVFNAHLAGATPMVSVSTPQIEHGRMVASYGDERPLGGATLIMTPDRTLWPTREWFALPAEIDAPSRQVSAAFPREASAAFLSLLSADWLTTSSDILFF